MAQLGLKRVWAMNSKKCIKVVGNKTIYNSYAQRGVKDVNNISSIIRTSPDIIKDITNEIWLDGRGM
jgi:hypothetical protein